MFKYITVLSLATIMFEKTKAQKQTTHVQQFWTAYFNQTRLSERWGLWVDAHLRTKEDFFTNFSTSIARAGLTYYANNNLKLTAGYAYVSNYPSGSVTITQPEHRPWQQVQWHTNAKKSRAFQYLRLEERYRRKIADNNKLGDGYNFNWRLRYSYGLMLPLNKKPFAPKTFSFTFNDEIHVAFGKEIVNNYFDQNRFFVGFAYHVNTKDNIQFGYMNVFQQLPAGNQYRSLHVPRVFYFHNLDLRKKQKN
jgi:hypothetical protein